MLINTEGGFYSNLIRQYTKRENEVTKPLLSSNEVYIDVVEEAHMHSGGCMIVGRVYLRSRFQEERKIKVKYASSIEDMVYNTLSSTSTSASTSASNTSNTSNTITISTPITQQVNTQQVNTLPTHTSTNNNIIFSYKYPSTPPIILSSKRINGSTVEYTLEIKENIKKVEVIFPISKTSRRLEWETDKGKIETSLGKIKWTVEDKKQKIRISQDEMENNTDRIMVEYSSSSKKSGMFKILSAKCLGYDLVDFYVKYFKKSGRIEF